MQPKVSVCITTYNHAPYISQALDSVLSQRTDFGYEIVVGEDDSSDNTREIVREYAKRYPERIRMFLNSRSKVIYINGRATGRWNFINILNNARGEYIALLEGDDYWIDWNKLQKQVDFLDSHQDYSMCFSNARILNEDTSDFSTKTFCETHALNGTKATVQFSDMAAGHWVPTGTVVFRREFLQRFPRWFYKIPMGDWGIILLLLNKGQGGFLPECTAVYRVHDKGYWSSISVEEREKGRYQFLQIVRNRFGFSKAIPMNQLYYRLSVKRYQRANNLAGKVKWFYYYLIWFYYRLMQKFWRIF